MEQQQGTIKNHLEEMEETVINNKFYASVIILFDKVGVIKSR